MPRLCGWHCSHPGCNNSWSFTCDKCDQVVCRPHFKYENHQCPHHREGDARVVLCPCCDSVVHVSVGENANQALVNHMESQACQRERGLRSRNNKDEVRGYMVCFPYSVHKLLGNSHKKVKKRLVAMTEGMYGFSDIKAALLGTDVKIKKLDMEFPVFPESLEPGSYVFGSRGHMVGVRVFQDHSVTVHDNMYRSGIGCFEPTRYYCAWKVSFEGDVPTKPSSSASENTAFSTDIRPHSEWNAKRQQQHCFPWSVCKLLGRSNMDAQRRLKEMSGGPYEIRDVRAALDGTGVKLALLKLPLPQSLPEGNYIFARKGHVVGVCVREDGVLQVYDNEDTDGLGEFSSADYSRVWKLSSSQ